MYRFTISNGKMIGDFEGLYKTLKIPLQSKKKFETSKKQLLIIVN